jgi:uncharacterized membrane protein (UPF0182 family)
MQLIPIGNSIIYVRPFYAQGSGEGSYPLFQFVVVFSQDYGAYCGPSVQNALDQMLAQQAQPCSVSAAGTGATATPTTTTTTTTPSSATTAAPVTTSTTIPPATGSRQDLLNQAAKDLDDAQTALTNGDLAGYQRLVNDARIKVKQAQNASG